MRSEEWIETLLFLGRELFVCFEGSLCIVPAVLMLACFVEQSGLKLRDLAVSKVLGINSMSNSEFLNDGAGVPVSCALYSG